jgi:flagellar hook-basal body complex protein FliE
VSIAPIGGGWSANAVSNPIALGGASPVDDAVPAAAGSGFGNILTDSIAALEKSQGESNDLAIKAATGDLTDVHDYMIASSKASLMTEMTVAVRNKAVEAFNDIMRMPV